MYFRCLFLWILAATLSVWAAPNDPSLPESLPETPKKEWPSIFSLEQDIPSQPDEDHFFKDFVNMMTSLGIILVLIFLISWILKKTLNTRIQQLNTNSQIKILERRSLTPKTTLYLLDIKGREIVMAESSNGVSVLGEAGSDPYKAETIPEEPVT